MRMGYAKSKQILLYQLLGVIWSFKRSTVECVLIHCITKIPYLCPNGLCNAVLWKTTFYRHVSNENDIIPLHLDSIASLRPRINMRIHGLVHFSLLPSYFRVSTHPQMIQFGHSVGPFTIKE